MKSKLLIGLILLLVGLWLLNKVRIIVFASFWNIGIIVGAILLGVWLISGPLKRFKNKYGGD